MKAMLLSYKPHKFQALNSTGIIYDIEFIRLRFFGLIKTKGQMTLSVPFESISAYKEHWDYVIENKLITNFNWSRK